MLCGGVGSSFLGLLLDPDPVRGPWLDPRKSSCFSFMDHYM